MKSIRRELTIQILAGALVLLFVAGSVFFAAIHHQLTGDFDRMLDAESEMLARNAERKGLTIVWDVPDAYTAGSRENADPAYCQLFLEDGTVVGLSQTLGVENLPHLAGRDEKIWNAPLPNGHRGRLVQKIFVPSADNTEPQIATEDPREQTFILPETASAPEVRLVLVVARNREGLDRVIRTLGLAGGAVAVLLSCGLALLVRRAIARGLRPIEEMNAQIAAIAPDALATRLHVAAPPVELAAIETAVNRLLDRVESAFAKERRFSSDLAHELRTPIAELRAACEIGERWPDDPESARQFFHDAHAIALQLDQLVATMLTLSRCENGAAPTRLRRLPLRPLVRDCWRPFAAAADQKNLRFEEHLPPGLTVECDEEKLAIILRNLLENAVAHSEPGTVVECRGEPGELRLANTAKDLSPADLPYIFDRFWRKDPARTDRQHSGLGLSIARGLGELLGLQLSARLSEAHRFEVRLIFPTENIPAVFSES